MGRNKVKNQNTYCDKMAQDTDAFFFKIFPGLNIVEIYGALDYRLHFFTANPSFFKNFVANCEGLLSGRKMQKS